MEGEQHLNQYDHFRTLEYSDIRKLPEEIRACLTGTEYSKIRLTDYLNGRLRIDLHHPKELPLDTPFQPLAVNEARLLSSSAVTAVEKFFHFTGVTGYLHVGYYNNLYIHDTVPCFTPWEQRNLTKEDAISYPVGMGMCFNETAKMTPQFELLFPGTPNDRYHSLVAEWDDVAGVYDATHFTFESGKLDENGVELHFPLDEEKLALMRMVPSSNFIHYPKGYGRYLEHP